MKNPRFIFGLFVILIGVSFLIEIPLFRFALAFFVMWLGFSIITGSDAHKRIIKSSKNSEDSINRVLIFSAIKQKVLSNDFSKAELVVVFGGGELDLSQVKTKQKQVTIEVVAIFGGLKIIIPPSWQVKSEGVGILGGFNNQAQLKGSKKTTAIIEGVAIFGGVDISN